MLVDSDVLIWYLRGSLKAKKVIEKLSSFSISSVNYMEIIQELQNKKELQLWKFFLRDFGVRHILIDEEITSKAIFWMEEFSLTHGLRMSDALIASTVDTYGIELLTGNHQDFKFLPGLKITKYKN